MKQPLTLGNILSWTSYYKLLQIWGIINGKYFFFFILNKQVIRLIISVLTVLGGVIPFLSFIQETNYLLPDHILLTS